MKSADPSRTVLQFRDWQAAAGQLGTIHLALLIIDVAFLPHVRETPHGGCLVLVHSHHDEQTARARGVRGIVRGSMTTQELLAQMEAWLPQQEFTP